MQQNKKSDRGQILAHDLSEQFLPLYCGCLMTYDIWRTTYEIGNSLLYGREVPLSQDCLHIIVCTKKSAYMWDCLMAYHFILLDGTPNLLYVVRLLSKNFTQDSLQLCWY